MPAVMAATTVKTALTARRMKIAGDPSCEENEDCW